MKKNCFSTLFHFFISFFRWKYVNPYQRVIVALLPRIESKNDNKIGAQWIGGRKFEVSSSFENRQKLIDSLTSLDRIDFC